MELVMFFTGIGSYFLIGWKKNQIKNKSKTSPEVKFIAYLLGGTVIGLCVVVLLSVLIASVGL
jgi:hypothetical protein